MTDKKYKNITELSISLTDRSAKEFAEELIVELKYLHEGYDTHAMTDQSMYLQGQKDMLSYIIAYISKAKP